MADETLLVMTGIGVPPYSARGLEETLTPIPQSRQTRRNWNGTLLDRSDSNFQKYSMTLSGSDQTAPSIDGVWAGAIVDVDCITKIPYHDTSVGPSRTPVPGSLITDGDWNYYRPRLRMMVMDYQVKTNEYGAAVAWEMELEEI